MSKGDPLLEVTDLVKHFPIKSGVVIDREVARVRAVDGVSLSLREGETLGLVGESGCGKSTLCRAILQLTHPTSGSVRFLGEELVGRSRRDLRPLRRQMQMIFQDPFASLNPRKRVGQIVGDPLELHGLAKGAELKRRVQELLDRVGLNPEHYNRYPARVLRRAAPAHRHREGAGSASEVDRRRRTGVGPRRVGAGADHQPAQGTSGRVRPVVSVRRPRPRRGPARVRPGRGDVSGQGRREFGHRGPVPQADSPVHECAAVGGADSRSETQRRTRAAGAAGRCAEPDRPAAGLQLPHAMPVGHRGLRDGRARTCSNTPRRMWPPATIRETSRRRAAQGSC